MKRVNAIALLHPLSFLGLAGPARPNRNGQFTCVGQLLKQEVGTGRCRPAAFLIQLSQRKSFDNVPRQQSVTVRWCCHKVCSTSHAARAAGIDHLDSVARVASMCLRNLICTCVVQPTSVGCACVCVWGGGHVGPAQLAYLRLGCVSLSDKGVCSMSINFASQQRHCPPGSSQVKL